MDGNGETTIFCIMIWCITQLKQSLKKAGSLEFLPARIITHPQAIPSTGGHKSHHGRFPKVTSLCTNSSCYETPCTYSVDASDIRQTNYQLRVAGRLFPLFNLPRVFL